MIEELKVYADFKPTGLPWLERIPSHWKLVPNRALMRRRKQLVGRNHHRYVLLSLTKQGIIIRDVASGKGKFSSDMGTSQVVRVGDLVFCFFDVPETPRTVGLSSHHGMITSAYTVLEPLQPSIAPYFELFYRAMDDSKMLSPLYSGLRNTIPVDRFLGTKTPLPPPDEQAAIVRFLGYANRRIDQFIRTKKRLIALLNEQKQAIVHRAVTRGLDPYVKLKDSGAPWLGKIPAHWETAKLKHYITSIEQGWSPQCDSQPAENYDEWAVLKVGCVNRDAFSPHQNKKLPRSLHPRPQLAVNAGDILMSRANTPSLVGLAALVDKPYPRLMISDKHYRFRVHPDRVDDQFLVLALRSSPTRAQIESATNGASSSMQNISQQLVGNLLVALPGIDEQRLIRAESASSTAGLSKAIAATEQELAYASEYRTRLISDVVAGQLDVRASAAALPEFRPEAASADSFHDQDSDIDDNEAA